MKSYESAFTLGVLYAIWYELMPPHTNHINDLFGGYGGALVAFAALEAIYEAGENVEKIKLIARTTLDQKP